MKSPSIGRIIGASFIALAVGLAQPMLVTVNMLVCVIPVLMCVLYAWAGWIPATVAAGAAVGSLTAFARLMGINPYLTGAAALAVLVAPGVMGIMMLKSHVPFFKRMRVSVALQALVMAAAVGVVYQILGVDLVDAFTGSIRSTMSAMPQDMLQLMLSLFAAAGLLTQESIEGLTKGIVTWVDVNRALDQAFEEWNYQLRQMVPVMMANSALLTGLFMTALSGKIVSRREGESAPAPVQMIVDGQVVDVEGRTPERINYVPLREWFLPAQAVGGLALCLAVSLALVAMNVSGGAGAATVFLSLAATVFTIQGAAALSRGLHASGIRRGVRVALIVAALMLTYVRSFVEMLGILSALFGRKGAISGWLRKRAEERGKDDDE